MGRSIIGFDVRATDGDGGKIDEAIYETNVSHLVIETGWWLLEWKVLVPVGAVPHIDFVREKVYVNSTRNLIKGSPPLEAEDRVFTDPGGRDRIRAFYAGTYRARR